MKRNIITVYNMTSLNCSCCLLFVGSDSQLCLLRDSLTLKQLEQSKSVRLHTVTIFHLYYFCYVCASIFIPHSSNILITMLENIVEMHLSYITYLYKF